MTAEVTIYTKSACPNCDKSKALMKKLDIEYTEISLEEDPAVLEFIKSEGFMAAPVIMTADDAWSGFDAAKIQALKPAETSDDDWDF